MTKLTHLDEQGRASMVDISGKSATSRRAVAEGVVLMSRETFDLVQSDTNPKGNVERTAELAGIMGAKTNGGFNSAVPSLAALKSEGESDRGA